MMITRTKLPVVAAVTLRHGRAPLRFCVEVRTALPWGALSLRRRQGNDAMGSPDR